MDEDENLMSMGKRVIILGGGIAGLFTAYCISAYFEEVVVLERGEYTQEPAIRSHVPQGAHVHVLLARGLKILSERIPSLPTWFDELGLPEKDLTQDIHVRFGDGWLPKKKSGVPLRPCTRPVLEHLLLRAVHTRPNIHIHERARAVGLEIKEGTVRGVSYERQDSLLNMDADLVIDAAGRSSRTMAWLRDFGIQVVEETVNAHVTYNSCLFRPTKEIDADWVLIGNSTRFPDIPENAVIMDIGNGQWLSAVVSYGRIDPPEDVQQFVDRAGKLLSEPYASLLREAQPLSSVVRYTNTANRWRKFGRSNHWPERFIVIGDSVCTLNPRYGQGMTLAALATDTLVEELVTHHGRRQTLDGFSALFQRSLDSRLALPWQVALLEDRLWVTQQERQRPGLLQRMIAASSRRLLETVFTDLQTYIRFMRVAHMLDHPTRLMSPVTMAKVLLPWLRHSDRTRQSKTQTSTAGAS